ncbi:MAG: 1-acyl-sn-glycerol-3-phosphate acyltransferase [Lachnospiraceae bacterium]|nr:1-acyl-sn-glycerol-3-phosphate acyltransferase [Lachnospiraceae bacterium]
MDHKNFERFDMAKPPVRTKWYLRPLTILLSLPDVWKHRVKITKVGTEGLKPPYVLLCNHNAFMDFKVATKAIFPKRANYVVAIDGFIGREKLLRNVGCICKRKFTNDVVLVRQLHQVIKNGDIAVIYPEARYSLCGTTAVLPESLGKLCKVLKVPVVTMICHGHHVNSPFWNLHDRKIKPTEAEMTCIFTPEELANASVDEINRKIVEMFQYDDFAWQKERGRKTKYKGNAEGLHKVLYQCPVCGTEYRMNSSGLKLFCEACHSSWTMSELGELSFDEGSTHLEPESKIQSSAVPTGFTHIPDWYEWERAQVRAEVEAGTYSTGDLSVHVDTLPNAKKFIRLGNGIMRHDMTGFHVQGTDDEGQPFSMEISARTQYSVHIEYEYLGKYGDCVDLNTLEDTWYTYPHGRDYSVTKMALATEELFFYYRKKEGRPCKPGLA